MRNNITNLRPIYDIKAEPERSYLLAKEKPLIDILNEIQPNNHWQTDYFHAQFDEIDMKPILIRSLNYLKAHQKEYIDMSYDENAVVKYQSKELMGHQVMMACKALQCIEKRNYKDAYYRLWYCIDGLSSITSEGRYINLNEYLIYRSLISYFIQSLDQKEMAIKKKLRERM
ncbi:hypothetical protein [Acetobacterium bakii]|uniref:Uncharacterized protein n=1 Tax=Acetobacterium bakii TaxID=52689 RepID=A0A0L6U1N4_9FIRM|nr:hypothetical protein [Acetobacterium bakii]KNZ42414.1 hypothetical protein AKG39_06510 [Acetobacterium bakii]